MPPTATQPPPPRTFVHHAKLISVMTLLSRILGVWRESLATKYFGDGVVNAAFRIGFMVPNLFRRLFGEGALSAAFIPLYSQALKKGDAKEAQRFAAATVNLLIVLLLILTGVGELFLWFIARHCSMGVDRTLAVKLTAIMLPYALLVCGTAFLGAILQVHHRFGLVAACPIILNIALIGGTIWAARHWGVALADTPAAVMLKQTKAMCFIATCVLAAGVAQVALLLPSLSAVGYRWQLASFFTPAIKRMLLLSLPVAVGAAVLQISTLVDNGLSLLLAQTTDSHNTLITHFQFFGHTIRYPMELAAVVRLGWAQYLYQFPLGLFAVAVATAIFPTLSMSAAENDHQRFRQAINQGIRLTLWEGLPASVGLIFVARPALQLLFERGPVQPHSIQLATLSLQIYSIGIWAYSLQQVLNRAYYALHDTATPLVLSIVTLLINLVVELPLLWTGMGEAGMAAGTSASFMVQAVIMLWILQRKIGSLELSNLTGYILKLTLATTLMAVACLAIQKMPFFPHDLTKRTALPRLLILMTTGAAVYLGACRILRVRMKDPLQLQ